MAIIGGHLGYRILRRLAPQPPRTELNSAQPDDSGLLGSFGSEFFDEIVGKTVLDFGCGQGFQTIDMARRGARHVIGLDIQTAGLTAGRHRAEQLGLRERCTFTDQMPGPVDIIVSRDAFEHFVDPAAILETMHRLLVPGGRVLASFGPTWLHPRGGHLFSVFPWSHLIFTECALIRWRSDFRHDGATRFSEVAGGLNQMTIRRFEQLVAASPLRLDHLDTVPIRGLNWLRHPWLREYGSSLVRCQLSRREDPPA